MAEISHSASGPPTKGLEYLSFSDKNTYLFCCMVAFAALLLFNPLTDFNGSFACAGGFEMDKDSSPKLIASLHKAHLKRTKNLQLAQATAAAAATAAFDAAEAAVAACCCKLEQPRYSLD
jgi:hypothetical protein